jgi:hypothetical protein
VVIPPHIEKDPCHFEQDERDNDQGQPPDCLSRQTVDFMLAGRLSCRKRSVRPSLFTAHNTRIYRQFTPLTVGG